MSGSEHKAPQQLPGIFAGSVVDPSIGPQHSPLRVGTIWTFDLKLPPIGVTPLTPVTFRRVGAESSAQLALAMALESAPADDSGRPARTASPALVSAGEAEFTQRLSSGRRCYTAWVRQQLAAYGWVSFIEEQVGELGLRLTLEPGEAYIWDCFTLPAFRQKRLYSALLGFILAELRTGGLRRAWIGADFTNTPSQRGIDRAGFLRVADVMISPEGNQHRFWAEGYPGVPEGIISAAKRVFLGSG